MPLSKLQTDILRLLAAHRNPESYVAGATVLNQHGPRFSGDIDIFHDREESVAQAAATDTALLAENGFSVNWLRREPGIHAAVMNRGDESMKLEWVRDSDFRFFPTFEDELFGYRLHVADLATNKALAAAGRSEPRDVLDLLYIHEKHLPLGAVIWAAVAKDPGYSPESLITEIRRNARYRQDDYADLDLTEPVDAALISQNSEDFLKKRKHSFEQCRTVKRGCSIWRTLCPFSRTPIISRLTRSTPGSGVGIGRRLPKFRPQW